MHQSDSELNFKNHPYQQNQDPLKDLSFANEEGSVATNRGTFWIILVLILPYKMLKIISATNKATLVHHILILLSVMTVTVSITETDLCYWTVLQLTQESLLVNTSSLFRQKIDL